MRNRRFGYAGTSNGDWFTMYGTRAKTPEEQLISAVLSRAILDFIEVDKYERNQPESKRSKDHAQHPDRFFDLSEPENKAKEIGSFAWWYELLGFCIERDAPSLIETIKSARALRQIEKHPKYKKHVISNIKKGA